MEIDPKILYRYAEIDNADLAEICFRCYLVGMTKTSSIERKARIIQLIDLLEKYEAVFFRSNAYSGIDGVSDYVILSSSHGWFKGTAYEGKSYVNVCIDDSEGSEYKYALLAISSYDWKLVDQLKLQKIYSLSEFK